ncbi:MAG: Heme chaperone HemW [Actinomycetota bacterium]|jgi:oxygen-independent coproporphyrinogen-3 oxidase
MAQLPEGDAAPTDGALEASVLTDIEKRTMHAYVHIPFCRVRCGYCDFNTYTSSELRGVTQSSFQTDLHKEIDFARDVLTRAKLPARELSTVFFGGGTPTQLAAIELVGILEHLGDNFGISAGAEVTSEANPDNVDFEYLQTLANGGFTRISLGMQSAVPEVLATLDRSHNPANVAQAVKAAKDAGLQVSVDLIYGAPGETVAQWKQSVEAALELGVDHISAYSLIVEPGTKLARQIRSGDLAEPHEDEQAEKYELADAAFAAAGFEWYEVSNWSRSLDTASKHNLAYWKSNDWWGFGPGAHSHIGGTRWWNVKHPAAYAEKLSVSNSPALARETLDVSTRNFERLLLELRIREGVEVELVEQTAAEPKRAISELIADGLIDGSKAIAGRVVLTARGRLLADAVLRRLS